ncbi:MAG: 4-oxalomesaconate tautomerase, partial [Silicimonas sp.]|nr:4-oxalomesaconate tautomerase [Silicimonas sp.]NND41611.1 4-oxalomesaconate tautomerase [Silicimonas sp.]
PNESPARVVLEHASGQIEVLVDFDKSEGAFTLNSAGLVRTARKLSAGEVFVPRAVWTNRPG